MPRAKAKNTTELLILCLFFFSSGKYMYYVQGVFTLLPSPDSVNACAGQQLTLTCITSNAFIEWSITPSHGRTTLNRLIPFSGVHGFNPVYVNSASLHFYRQSGSGVLPLIALLRSENVTIDLNMTMVNCTELAVDGSVSNSDSTLTTVIHIVQTSIDVDSPKLLPNIELFSANFTSVYLEWIWESNLSYNVSIFPSVDSIQYNGTSAVDIILSYNTLYNVSIMAFLCGENIATTQIMLRYAQCDYPLNNNQEYSLHDHDTLVLGYNVPSLEGSNITFACFPGMVLTGPTASTCMSSGLWIPNPKEVICLANCGHPPANNNLSLVYNSTLESSLLLFKCKHGLFPTDLVTAVCHGNGSWAPHPQKYICFFAITGNSSSESDIKEIQDSTILYVSTVSPVAAILIVLSFFLFTGCVCLYKKRVFSLRELFDQDSEEHESNPQYEDVSSSTPTRLSPDTDTILAVKLSTGEMLAFQQSQPIPIYEDIAVYQEGEDTLLSDNVAYSCTQGVKMQTVNARNQSRF